MVWAPPYVPVAGDDGLAAYVRTPATDPFLATLGPAAARAVDTFTNRQFGQLTVPATFTYDAHRASSLPDGSWVLEVDDVQDITGATVTVDGSPVLPGTDGYRWWPRNAAAKGQPYTALQFADRPCGDVDVFAKFGWSAVPDAVPSAVRLQTNRWFVRRESPYGVAGAVDAGTGIQLIGVLDPDVRTLLSVAGLVRARMPR